jgi:pilus assembly protein CpaB
MDRRKALLAVAAVIAALGTMLVFLYVRGADVRADERYEAVQVLRVVKQIEPGETVEAAQAAGKFETSSVSQKDLLPEALTTTDGIADKVAISTIYPREQLTSSKFGATAAAAAASGLTIPKGKFAISINLADEAKKVAGFVNPGDKVAIFMTKADGEDGFTRLLMPNIQVIGVGTTTLVAPPATDPEGVAAPVEELPKTLVTVAVTQVEAERLLYASGSGGELSFGLPNSDSKAVSTKGVTESNLFKAP